MVTKRFLASDRFLIALTMAIMTAAGAAIVFEVARAVIHTHDDHGGISPAWAVKLLKDNIVMVERDVTVTPLDLAAGHNSSVRVEKRMIYTRGAAWRPSGV